MAEVKRREFLQTATVGGLGTLISPIPTSAQSNPSVEFLDLLDKYVNVLTHGTRPGEYTDSFQVLYEWQLVLEKKQYPRFVWQSTTDLTVKHPLLVQPERVYQKDGSYVEHQKAIGVNRGLPFRIHQKRGNQVEVLEDTDLDGKVNKWYDPRLGDTSIGVEIQNLPPEIQKQLQSRFESGIGILTRSVSKYVQNYFKL